MTHAYGETYLNDAMNNLGDMFDYAICDLGYKPERFFPQFLASGVAERFGRGNPKYVAGLSGPELAIEVVYRMEGKRPTVEPSVGWGEKSPIFWAGWALAYYQWYTGDSFAYLAGKGLGFGRVLSLYPTLHEADITKFAAVAGHIVGKGIGAAEGHLPERPGNP